MVSTRQSAKYKTNRLSRVISKSFLSGIVSILLCTFTTAHAESITVNVTKDLGDVNRSVLGNNMVGYPMALNSNTGKWVYRGYHIDGAGVWNTSTYSSVPEMVNFARDIGMSFSRFPGGCGAHWYNWKDAVGTIPRSSGFTFGLPEFLKNTQDIGAIPVITVSRLYRNGAGCSRPGGVSQCPCRHKSKSRHSLVGCTGC